MLNTAKIQGKMLADWREQNIREKRLFKTTIKTYRRDGKSDQVPVFATKELIKGKRGTHLMITGSVVVSKVDSYHYMYIVADDVQIAADDTTVNEIQLQGTICRNYVKKFKDSTRRDKNGDYKSVRITVFFVDVEGNFIPCCIFTMGHRGLSQFSIGTDIIIHSGEFHSRIYPYEDTVKKTHEIAVYNAEFVNVKE